MALDSKFNFEKLEPNVVSSWDEAEIYKWNYNDAKSFVIDTPPPTVSGNLHMGHVFSYCHTDFIARYKRLSGSNVFYPIGFDDNGLPTERLVEKVKGVKIAKLEADRFLSMCKEVSESSKSEFRKLFKSLGISFDWNLEYSTMDERCRRVSQESFIDLYRKGFIYRKVSPVVWDIKDRTAIAHAEIEEKEVSSWMNEIFFATELGYNVTIATTRPELLPACVAVFFHPDDARYQSLADQKAIVPLFGYVVPFFADKDVKMDKGTGLVMCCTFGDEQDVKWWERHGLPTKLIISDSGKLECRGIVSKDELGIVDLIEGLDVFQARNVIVDKLQEHNLIVSRKEIIHSVKCAERSGSLLEIRLTPQWFVDVLSYKNEFLAKINECKWHPIQMKKRIEIWVENLNADWCISRQRYLGVHFPVWYSKKPGEEGQVILAEPKQLPVDPKSSLPAGYLAGEVDPDYDVMDTWATSSLTPQINAHPFLSDGYSPLFPADMRAQSHEIIRTWAFYTLVRSFFHSGNIPWQNVMISGWCLADDKSKMSKSKGNIVQPAKIITEYGADVVRLWTGKASLGSDTVLSMEAFKACKKFVNKLWNAGRFIQQFVVQDFSRVHVTETMDTWVLRKFWVAVHSATVSFEKFDYCSALEALESFFWNEFCDLYLEIVKKRAYGSNEIDNAAVASARNCLSYILYNLLIAFAPFVPFITDVMFRDIFHDKNVSVHANGNWLLVQEDALSVDEKHSLGDYCIEIVKAVRKMKSSLNLSIGAPISELFISPFEPTSFQLDMIVGDVASVCCAANVFCGTAEVSNVSLETENFIVSIIFNNEEK